MVILYIAASIIGTLGAAMLLFDYGAMIMFLLSPLGGSLLALLAALFVFARSTINPLPLEEEVARALNHQGTRPPLESRGGTPESSPAKCSSAITRMS